MRGGRRGRSDPLRPRQLWPKAPSPEGWVRGRSVDRFDALVPVAGTRRGRRFETREDVQRFERDEAHRQEERGVTPRGHPGDRARVAPGNANDHLTASRGTSRSRSRAVRASTCREFSSVMPQPASGGGRDRLNARRGTPGRRGGQKGRSPRKNIFRFLSHQPPLFRLGVRASVAKAARAGF